MSANFEEFKVEDKVKRQHIAMSRNSAFQYSETAMIVNEIITMTDAL